MNAHRSIIKSKANLATIVLLLIGAGLMIGAWGETKASPPAGWTNVSEAVGITLDNLESPGNRSDKEFDDVSISAKAATGGEASRPSQQESTAAAGSNQGTVGASAAGQESGERHSDAGGESATSSVDQAVSTATGAALSESAAQEGKIDINHATADELDALPGIGAAKAKAIVAEREAGGAFGSADDLLRVKGIGPKMLAKLKPHVVALP